MTTDLWLLVAAAIISLFFVKRAARLAREIQVVWTLAQKWGENFEILFITAYIATLWMSGWYMLKGYYPVFVNIFKGLRILFHF